MDLNKHFSKLDPGDYRIQIVWPAAGCTIGGLPSYKPRELASGIGELEVAATSVDIANKMFEGPGATSPGAILELAQPSNDSEKTGPKTATLANKGTAAIFLPLYYPIDDNGHPVFETPLRPIVEWTKWHPDASSWLYQKAKFATGRRYLYRLGPGESVQLSLPNSFQGLDGIYQYTIPAFSNIRGRIKQDGKFYYAENLSELLKYGTVSKWFVVEHSPPKDIH